MESETFLQMAVRHANELMCVPVKALDENLKNPVFVRAIDLFPNGYNSYYQFTCGFKVIPTTSEFLQRIRQSELVERIRKGYIPIPS